MDDQFCQIFSVMNQSCNVYISVPIYSNLTDIKDQIIITLGEKRVYLTLDSSQDEWLHDEFGLRDSLLVKTAFLF